MIAHDRRQKTFGLRNLADMGQRVRQIDHRIDMARPLCKRVPVTGYGIVRPPQFPQRDAKICKRVGMVARLAQDINRFLRPAAFDQARSQICKSGRVARPQLQGRVKGRASRFKPALPFKSHAQILVISRVAGIGGYRAAETDNSAFIVARSLRHDPGERQRIAVRRPLLKQPRDRSMGCCGVGPLGQARGLVQQLPPHDERSPL